MENRNFHQRNDDDDDDTDKHGDHCLRKPINTMLLKYDDTREEDLETQEIARAVLEHTKLLSKSVE